MNFDTIATENTTIITTTDEYHASADYELKSESE